MNRQAVIRDLIVQIFLPKIGRKLAEWHIQKILYELKIELPKGDTTADCLPYYWYTHGPFCECIRSELSRMVDDGVLASNPHKGMYGNTYFLFELVDYCYKPTLDPRAILALNSIMESFNEYDADGFCRDIYEKNAPYEFMTLFNIHFIEHLKYVNDMVTMEIYPGEEDLRILKNLLIESECELPLDPIFEKYKELFFIYMSSTNRILMYYKNGGDNYDLLTEAYSQSQTLWTTFAKGVRTLDKGHDAFYEKYVNGWKKQYFSSLIYLAISLDKYSNYVLQTVGDKGFTMIDDKDKESKDVLSTVIGGYLS